jgi:prolyl 4-hydroxylase
VLNAEGKPVYASYRITKTTFLGANEHPTIGHLNRRIGQMTNLNMESAFDMKVFKYPIGGHYTPHYDFTQVINIFLIKVECT